MLNQISKSFLLSVVSPFVLVGLMFGQSKPFPQAQTFPNCIKPNHVSQAELNHEVGAYYDYWKAKYLKNDLTTLPNGYYVKGEITGSPEGYEALGSSEGQGYGMIITALMAGYDAKAKVIFDGLFLTAKTYRSSANPNLMGWVVADESSAQGHFGSATDGDMDIAYALLLAHKQWGSQGEVNYLEEAKKVIEKGLLVSCVTTGFRMNFGDWAELSTTNTRPSDWMLSHFKTFKSFTNDVAWEKVSETTYEMIKVIQVEYSSTTGLMPDFATGAKVKPAGPDFLEGENDGNYYYNACRTPWRIVMDYGHYGDLRAKSAVSKMLSWAVAKSNGDPTNIKAGYTLDGKDLEENDYQSGCFIAPFVAASTCDAAYQDFLNSGWMLMSGMRDGYYEDTVNLLCQLYISGNWWLPKVGE